MPLLDLEKMTSGLSRDWARFLRDWDRTLRSGNYPETTRYNYLLAAAQLARYLAECSPDPDADDAADDPTEVTKAHVEAFQSWMGKEFVQLRDEAIIRLYSNTGARLSEVANLALDDIDLDSTDSVHYHGKGNKDRRVRFGPKTARALSRYLRARAKHSAAALPDLWLAERGKKPLAANGIKIMLKRRGLAAGLTGVHAHRWRHNFAHEWKLAGGTQAT